MEITAISTYARLATYVICGAVAAISLLAWYQRHEAHKRSAKVQDWVRLTPSIANSLGVFGTFLGIFLGLQHFDTSDINSSIPSLLEGLKTAFVTSLCGMFFSMFLSFRFSKYDFSEAERSRDSSEDPLVVLHELASYTAQINDRTERVGEALIKCFRSDEDYSVVTQLKLIRTDMSDMRREVSRSLEEFSAKVAQLGTEALIEALKGVIEKFEARLGDLVGSEFQQLREAMIELNTWQKQYKELIESVHQKLVSAVSGIEQTTASIERSATALTEIETQLDNIDDDLAGVTVSAESIQQHIENLRGENAKLALLLDQVRILGEEAKHVLPNISKHVTESSSNLVAASELAKKQFENAGAVMEKQINESTLKLVILQEQQLRNSQQFLSTLNEQLEGTLDDSLASLGSQLAALSQKFVSDYGPLTERLRAVVKLAEGTDGDRRS